jgi:hypothetical protein
MAGAVFNVSVCKLVFTPDRKLNELPIPPQNQRDPPAIRRPI